MINVVPACQMATLSCTRWVLHANICVRRSSLSASSSSRLESRRRRSHCCGSEWLILIWMSLRWIYWNHVVWHTDAKRSPCKSLSDTEDKAELFDNPGGKQARQFSYRRKKGRRAISQLNISRVQTVYRSLHSWEASYTPPTLPGLYSSFKQTNLSHSAVYLIFERFVNKWNQTSVQLLLNGVDASVNNSTWTQHYARCG